MMNLGIPRRVRASIPRLCHQPTPVGLRAPKEAHPTSDDVRQKNKKKGRCFVADGNTNPQEKQEKYLLGAPRKKEKKNRNKPSLCSRSSFSLLVTFQTTLFEAAKNTLYIANSQNNRNEGRSSVTFSFNRSRPLPLPFEGSDRPPRLSHAGFAAAAPHAIPPFPRC